MSVIAIYRYCKLNYNQLTTKTDYYYSSLTCSTCVFLTFTPSQQNINHKNLILYNPLKILLHKHKTIYTENKQNYLTLS